MIKKILDRGQNGELVCKQQTKIFLKLALHQSEFHVTMVTSLILF